MNRIALSIVAVAALAFSAVACAAPDAASEPGDEPTGQTAQAQTSNGFICNATRCVCDPDSDNPVDSCSGMERVCDLLGPGMLCAPGGWCTCLITKTKLSVAAEAETNPTPPRAGTVAATATKLAP